VKRAIVLAIAALCIICASCSETLQKSQSIFYGMFDTQITVTAYTKTENEFSRLLKIFSYEMGWLNDDFNIYESKSGKGIKTINASAGIAPVKASDEVLELLAFGLMAYEASHGAINMAIGPVTALWHDARQAAGNDQPVQIPSQEALSQAAALTDLGFLKIEGDMVFLEKAGMSLDVGAIAKGYAVQKVAEKLIDEGFDCFLIDAGGNVMAVGAPPNGLWKIALRNPDLKSSEPFYDILNVSGVACVTSGNYERQFEAGGFWYGHIIDPDTLQPAQTYASTTVICESSADADFLSTALFILPINEGKALASLYNAQAIWIMPDGSCETTDGYSAMSENY
jgi:thiamine biosynthesis lipoprotein